MKVFRKIFAADTAFVNMTKTNTKVFKHVNDKVRGEEQEKELTTSVVAYLKMKRKIGMHHNTQTQQPIAQKHLQWK